MKIQEDISKVELQLNNKKNKANNQVICQWIQVLEDLIANKNIIEKVKYDDWLIKSMKEEN